MTIKKDTEIVSELRLIQPKPIIATEYPDTNLSILFPYVSGFLFEHGSIMSHLGIKLRENYIPSVIIGDKFNSIQDSDVVSIVSGTVTKG